MKTLTEKLNLSATCDNDSAVKINKWSNVNYDETLSLYCAENDVNFDDISDDDWFAALYTLADHGQADKTTDSYYFWID